MDHRARQRIQKLKAGKKDPSEAEVVAKAELIEKGVLDPDKPAPAPAAAAAPFPVQVVATGPAGPPGPNRGGDMFTREETQRTPPVDIERIVAETFARLGPSMQAAPAPAPAPAPVVQHVGVSVEQVQSIVTAAVTTAVSRVVEMIPRPEDFIAALASLGEGEEDDGDSAPQDDGLRPARVQFSSPYSGETGCRVLHVQFGDPSTIGKTLILVYDADADVYHVPPRTKNPRSPLLFEVTVRFNDASDVEELGIYYNLGIQHRVGNRFYLVLLDGTQMAQIKTGRVDMDSPDIDQAQLDALERLSPEGRSAMQELARKRAASAMLDSSDFGPRVYDQQGE